MNHNRPIAHAITGPYYGRILTGDYSRSLQQHVAACIEGFMTFERSGNPVIAYVSAWSENQGAIWYEYVSQSLADLLGCPIKKIPEYMREHIIERREYRYATDGARVTQESLDRRAMSRTKEELRQAVKQSGKVEAVYKIALEDRRIVWLKDQAVSQTFAQDGISLSLGYLTLVTKEMETEEALKDAQKELETYRNHLEDLVQERNRELLTINTRLRREVSERKQVEHSLRTQSKHLEEVNTALNVLLKQREADKQALEEAVVSNVKELITPYVERMKKSRLREPQQILLGILEANLQSIVSPFIRIISSKLLNFTPMEIKVANLVKDGKTNQEIADLLFLSKNTVMVHRHHIRSKLRLKNKKANLRSYLLTLE